MFRTGDPCVEHNSKQLRLMQERGIKRMIYVVKYVGIWCVFGETCGVSHSVPMDEHRTPLLSGVNVLLDSSLFW